MSTLLDFRAERLRQRISQKLPHVSESRLQQIWDLIDSAESNSDNDEKIDLRVLLQLPPQDREAIVARQAQSIAHLFQSGSELVEWSDEYIEDENWDE